MSRFGFRRGNQWLGLSAVAAALLLSGSSCGGDTTSIGKTRPDTADASGGSSDGNIGSGGDGGSGFVGTGGVSGSGFGGDGGTGGSSAGAGGGGFGGTAGSGGSTAGSGGSAAGSGGSAAGSGGSAAGSGGSAGAAGSSGFTGGGGYAGEIVQGIGEKLDGACAEVVQAPCDTLGLGCGVAAGVRCPVGLCRTFHMPHVLSAILNGCLQQYTAYLDCMRQNPATICGTGNQCDAISTALSDCFVASRRCQATSSGEGTCAVACDPAPGAYCEPSAEGVHCLCTAGIRAGLEFTTAAKCGTPEWAAEVGNNCF